MFGHVSRSYRLLCQNRGRISLIPGMHKIGVGVQNDHNLCIVYDGNYYSNRRSNRSTKKMWSFQRQHTYMLALERPHFSKFVFSLNLNKPVLEYQLI